MQSVYFVAPAALKNFVSDFFLVSYPGHLLGSLTPLQRCSRCILSPQPLCKKFCLRIFFSVISRTLVGESYSFAKMQSVYFVAPAALKNLSQIFFLVSYPGHLLGSLTPLQRCSRCILSPQPLGFFFSVNPGKFCLRFFF